MSLAILMQTYMANILAIGMRNVFGHTYTNIYGKCIGNRHEKCLCSYLHELIWQIYWQSTWEISLAIFTQTYKVKFLAIDMINVFGHTYTNIMAKTYITLIQVCWFSSRGIYIHDCILDEKSNTFFPFYSLSVCTFVRPSDLTFGFH